ncbi:hypothetical protein AB0D08_14250 [Kitasatospora sp. NPDC048540]|uniref:hypothetical protein n=1 Tax=unclassified Kitasatospora TaxID=2633591 RepID=UPI00053B01B9|nr:hypothetical protein [Kitasatospora sp. MBT63]
MIHQMRAEYGPAGAASGEVKTWHIVRGDDTVAMCGRALDPDAETRDAKHWVEHPDLHCHSCGALFLREAPYLPTEHDE